MIKAVIFDYGKVLSGARGTRARLDIAEAYSSTDEEVGKCMAVLIPQFNTGKITEKQFWIKLSAMLHKKTPKNWYELWRASFFEHFDLNRPMIKYALSLKAKGLKVSILSNNIPPWTDIIRSKGGYAGFDDVVISCEVGFAKPDPRVYKLALKRLDIAGPEAIFVDDKEENLEVARSLGMQTVLADNPEQIIQDVNTVIVTSHNRAE